MSMRNAQVRLRCCTAFRFTWIVSYHNMTPGLFSGLSAARDRMQALPGKFALLQAGCRWSLQGPWTL